MQNIRWQNTLLTGEVPGRKAEPFSVMVHFSRPQGRLHASGECSCAVKNNCRHVAAVMLANLQPREAQPQPTEPLATVTGDPQPLLRLESRANFISGYGHYGHRQKRLDFAAVSFDYRGVPVPAGSQAESFAGSDGLRYRVARQMAAENAWLAQIHALGLSPIPAGHIYTPTPLPPTSDAPAAPEQWHALIKKNLPQLRKRGWQVSVEEEFSGNFTEVSAIEGRATRAGDGWFDLELAMKVGRRRVRLEPLLTKLFSEDPRWTAGNLSPIADDEAIELRDDRQQRLLFRAGQLKPLVANLIDLFTGEERPLRLAAWDTGRLGSSDERTRWIFDGEDPVHQLAERLSGNAGVQPVSPPQGLKAQLRDYQQQGVNWMQFLRQHQRAGVLADDMGLGNTSPPLAHLLLEKEAGRLAAPVLHQRGWHHD